MRLLFNEDGHVAQWMFLKSRCQPMQFNLAIGLVDDSGQIIGGFMFTGWNGSDAEVHYYGPKALKRRVVRAMMWIAANVLKLNRLTIRTRKESMARGVLKLGAEYEGTIKRLYGPTDEDRHAGHQYVFWRETILKLANKEPDPHVWRQ